MLQVSEEKYRQQKGVVKKQQQGVQRDEQHARQGRSRARAAAEKG